MDLKEIARAKSIYGLFFLAAVGILWAIGVLEL